MGNDDDDLHDKLMTSTRAVQQQLAGIISRMITMMAFGTLVPVLLMLAPAVSWLNLRAAQWVASHSEEKQFGEVLAEQILVQAPVFVFRNLGLALNLGVMVFVFLDLGFGLGPIVFYGI